MLLINVSNGNQKAFLTNLQIMNNDLTLAHQNTVDFSTVFSYPGNPARIAIIKPTTLKGGDEWVYRRSFFS